MEDRVKRLARPPEDDFGAGGVGRYESQRVVVASRTGVFGQRRYDDLVAHVHQRRRGVGEGEKRLPEVVQVQAALKQRGLEMIEEDLAGQSRGGLEIWTGCVRDVQQSEENQRSSPER